MATYAQPFEIADRVVVTAGIPTLGLAAGAVGVVVRVYNLPGQTTYNVSVRVQDDVRGTKDFEVPASGVTLAP